MPGFSPGGVSIKLLPFISSVAGPDSPLHCKDVGLVVGFSITQFIGSWLIVSKVNDSAFTNTDTSKPSTEPS